MKNVNDLTKQDVLSLLNSYCLGRLLPASIPKFINVVVRLEGFHLLISTKGAIGTIMAGGGLKELFCEIYATNSVDNKILSAHVYACAVRANSLAVLGGLIIELLGLKEEEL